MAAAFFDLSPQAFRAKERSGYFVSADNDDLTPRRNPGEEAKGYKHRVYSLYDIRRIAHALRYHGKMTDRQLRLVIMRIDAFSEPLLRGKRKHYYRNFTGWN